MKLYAYWASSASHRVRIALNLKGVAYDIVPVDLRGARAQHSQAYRKLNPHGRVPTLLLDDGTALTQSLAIIQWLEQTYPEPALIPADPILAARVTAFAQIVASDIQPLHVNKILMRLKAVGGLDDAGVAEWGRHWVAEGFDALEALAAETDARFAFTDAPGLAEIVLVPQMRKARDFGVDLSPYRRLCEIAARASALQAFADAAPERQPDAPRS